MNSIIASETCTLNHVHNISTTGSTLTPWTAEETRLIEAIVNHGDRDRLAQNLPSLCSTQTEDGVRVESWMSFLAGRIEWVNTNDEQLPITDTLYVFNMQFPWSQEAVPAIVISKDLLISIAKEENLSYEMLFAFWCLWGLSIACLDSSNLMIPCGRNSFEYRKGEAYSGGGFASYFRHIEATTLALEYLDAYYGQISKDEFDCLLNHLTTSIPCRRRGISEGVDNFQQKKSSPVLRIIFSEEKKITSEDVTRASQSKGLSGYFGIDLYPGKKSILNIKLNELPELPPIKLTPASTVWYLLLMQHPEGITRKELFTPPIMKDYLTIEHYLHKEDAPTDGKVESYCNGDKAIRNTLNQSLKRLRDTLKEEFAKHKGYNYSMFIPTEASTLTKSATRIAIPALHPPHNIKCYIQDDIKTMLN